MEGHITRSLLFIPSPYHVREWLCRKLPEAPRNAWGDLDNLRAKRMGVVVRGK
jgi:hypothetical protein